MITVYAPAKINLSLKILGKREDGFHELETVMIPLHGLYDTLTFEESGKFSFGCNIDGLPTDDTNLVVRAVKLFEERSKSKISHRIYLEKSIPHGAGLGGGSSDAATTLLTLNRLYGSPLTLNELHELTAEIGSDVPFFLYDSPCICKGRGDVIEPISTPPPFALCLLKPDFGVSTPDAYKRWMTSRKLKGIPYEAQDGPLGEMQNDLERPVFEKFLFLAECKRWLLDQPEVTVAQMSGSGSTMIAITKNLEQSLEIVERAKRDLDPNLFTWSGMTK